MKPVLIKSKYSPGRGGHAPSDIREAFGYAVDALLTWKGGPEPKIEVRDQRLTIRQVCGLVWNCSDTTPHMLFNDVCDISRWPEDEPSKHTYAACARVVAAVYDRTVRKAA
jgi:hypothetical protein